MAIQPIPLQPTNNLSDLASASTARTNLGLGSAATQASAAFDAAGAAATAQSNAESYAANASNLASGTVSNAVLPANLTPTEVNFGTAGETTLNGTSGSLVCSMPFQGSFKLAVIYFNGFHGTQTYGYPTAFTIAPTFIYGGSVANGNIASNLTYSIELTTSSAVTGFLLLIGM